MFPSLYEGFGFPPLEAMSCGIPVIASKSSSLPEVVGDAGILVDPDDVDSIAQGILKLLRDKNLREKLRKKGIQQVKKFTQEKMIEKTIEVYEEVVARGRS